MLSRSLLKNIFREIRATLTRFIAIFAITALGAGFFAGLRATSPDMKATADYYYGAQHLMDYRVRAPLGITEADVAALRAAPEIDAVMPTQGLDLLVARADGDEAARFNALPRDTGAANPDYLNRPVLSAGRLPQAAGECLADEDAGYALGEVVTLSAANEEAALELMAEREFTVVGLGRSPAYVSIMRGNTNIGSGSISAFFYTAPAAFDSAVYTDVYLTAAGGARVSAFSDAYADLTDAGAAALETLGEQRAPLRYAEIRGEAEAELADAERELAEGRAEADEKLGEAWQEITDGEAEIADGRAEIEENRRKLADAEGEIAEGEQALVNAQNAVDEGQNAYNGGLAEYETSYAQYAAQKKQVAAIAAGLKDAPAALAAMAGMLPVATPEDAAAFTGLAKGVMQAAGGAARLLAQAGDAALQPAIDGINAYIDAAGAALVVTPVPDFATALGALNALMADPGLTAAMDGAVAGAQAQLADAARRLADAEAALVQARNDLSGARQQIAAGRQELADARAELADGRQKLAEAEAELADAEQKLADGKAEYETEKAKADKEIAEAEGKIADGRQKLAELEPGEWIVQTREDNPGYSGFASDTGRIDAIATVIPLFFFLVAALVCLTTMTRMVEEQRTLIGTLKALGYAPRAIAAKYVGYAAMASIAGAVAGVLVGFYVFPWAIWQAYGILYSMAELHPAGNVALAVGSIAVSVLITTLATLAACLAELRSTPASLLRPKAPRAGKRVILERLPFIWNRMGFMAKVTARNLLRYKKRFFMTVLGVAGCTALLVTGFGLRDSINGIVPRQYGGLYHYQIQAVLEEPSTPDADTPLNTLLGQLGKGLYTAEALIDAETDAGTSGDMTTTITAVEDPTAMAEFITLQQRKTGVVVAPPLGTGAVITEKLATRLKADVGDTIRVSRVNEAPAEVVVQGVVENYILNYVYVTAEGWQALFNEAPEYTGLTIILNDTAPAAVEGALQQLLKARPVAGAANISVFRDQFTDMFESLNAVVWLIIIAAGLLAFVVLYNLTNINITERQREIATLKVLGFYNGEVAGYVYRENLLLTLIGIGAGLALGVFLHDFVVVTAEVDEVMFRRVIEPLSYVWSVVFTLGTAGLVNLVMLGRLRGVDMVESLKSME